MEAAVKLVRKLGGVPVACVFVIELAFLPGRKKLDGLAVHSLMQVG
jgi:adenine phosphoribosyltransferase